MNWKGKWENSGPRYSNMWHIRGYLEVSLCLLLLRSQLREGVLQRLRLGRVKLPLLLQRSGPLFILLQPGAQHSKGRWPFPPRHNSQEGRGSVLWWGMLNYLAALSKEALTGTLSVFHFNNTGIAGESQVDSSWMEHSQPPDEVQEHQRSPWTPNGFTCLSPDLKGAAPNGSKEFSCAASLCPLWSIYNLNSCHGNQTSFQTCLVLATKKQVSR